MTRCAMVWTTAGTNRVCPRCLPLKGKVVGYTDEEGVQIPPLHPRCRCAIDYREVGADALTTPRRTQTLPNVTPNITALPNGAGVCKNFDELKLYWAENYNVKVGEDISKLHFNSVRAALSGVEAVLKEFPPAGLYLKEIGLCKGGFMGAARGEGIIAFNVEYFKSERNVKTIIEAGIRARLYPKNMKIFGAGAHEAAHIVEDWLIAKYDSANTPFRPIPRRLIREAYQNAILTPAGKGKSFDTLKEEIATYAKENPSECLASAVSDYMTNGANSAILSIMIWRRLKEELAKMLFAPGQLKVYNFSSEERKRYGVFDDWGEMTGVKEDAPKEFKEAYEHDKKLEAKTREKGFFY